KPLKSARSLVKLICQRFGAAPRSSAAGAKDTRPLPDRMAAGLERYTGPVLLIMSGQDLTAREFDDTARASASWRRLMADPRVSRRDLAAADHTFSRRIWRDTVAEWTFEWIQ